ncbi:MAG: ribonuclease R, partial [Bacteroidota bacterium]
MTYKKKKHKRKNLPSYNKKTLKKFIIDIFRRNAGKLYNYKQIAKRLDVKDNETRKLINNVLYQLVDEEKLEEVYTGKFKFVTKGAFITGIVDMTMRGTAYIVSDDIEEDVFVSQANLNHALNGDEVKVYISARKKRRQLEGEVVEIIKQARSTFVGIVEISKHFAFLIPEGRNMPHDLFIPLNKLNGAKNGVKAIA